MSENQISDRLFIGLFPGGVVYADRGREVHGDYAKLAFLPYGSLTLAFESGSDAFRAAITAHAATVQAKRGGTLVVSACGQTVALG